MAKHKGDDDELKTETPSNTTSGGKAPKPTEGVADVKKGEGTAVYPPSPGDQAGEKTDNVAPTKKLPPDPPAGEGVDELTRLRAQFAAVSAALSNLGVNAAAVAAQAVKDMPEAQPAKRGPVKKAWVAGPDGVEVEVEYPADAQNPDTAAVDAYKEKAGLWSLPSQPAVRHDAKKGK
jgi:hypothetical protein